MVRALRTVSNNRATGALLRMLSTEAPSTTTTTTTTTPSSSMSVAELELAGRTADLETSRRTLAKLGPMIHQDGFQPGQVKATIVPVERVKTLSSKYTYVHHCTLQEYTMNDFMKTLAHIERQLQKKFGSTYNIRVNHTNPKRTMKFQLLRSPFVYKKAQDHYKFETYSYNLTVTYTFQLTDPALNQYVYSLFKQCLENIHSVVHTGYSISTKGRRFIPPAEGEDTKPTEQSAGSQ